MFVALVIQHVMRMRLIVICSQSGCSIFSHIFSKRHDFFFKKGTEYKMCVLISSTVLSETLLILRRSERDIIKIVYWSSRKVPVIIVRL